mmetsp:Transcript_36776/g.113443  ORF Transcript_36776/g.113443 Transcript_36776/m.113443 type:complete len:204 (-) Transcript_36776:907-1518(-)
MLGEQLRGARPPRRRRREHRLHEIPETGVVPERRRVQGGGDKPRGCRLALCRPFRELKRRCHAPKRPRRAACGLRGSIDVVGSFLGGRRIQERVAPAARELQQRYTGGPHVRLGAVRVAHQALRRHGAEGPPLRQGVRVVCIAPEPQHGRAAEVDELHGDLIAVRREQHILQLHVVVHDAQLLVQRRERRQQLPRDSAHEPRG